MGPIPYTMQNTPITGYLHIDFQHAEKGKKIVINVGKKSHNQHYLSRIIDKDGVSIALAVKKRGTGTLQHKGRINARRCNLYSRR